MFDWSTVPIWRVLATTAGGYLAIQVAKFLNTSIIGPALSPLRKLPGPLNSQGTLLWGHLSLIFAAQPNELHEQWFEKYGSTITYRGILMASTFIRNSSELAHTYILLRQARRLSTKDPRAVSHILTHAYEFPKPDSLRQMLVRIFGNGQNLCFLSPEHAVDFLRRHQVFSLLKVIAVTAAIYASPILTPVKTVRRFSPSAKKINESMLWSSANPGHHAYLLREGNSGTTSGFSCSHPFDPLPEASRYMAPTGSRK